MKQKQRLRSIKKHQYDSGKIGDKSQLIVRKVSVTGIFEIAPLVTVERMLLLLLQAEPMHVTLKITFILKEGKIIGTFCCHESSTCLFRFCAHNIKFRDIARQIYVIG